MSIIIDVSLAVFNIVKGIAGTFYNFDKDVENKKGIKHKDNEENANKGLWAKTKTGISNTIDFFFGPSTLKLITLLSIGFLALSPFGTVAIAIAAGVSVLTLGLGLVIEGKNLKDLRVQQKEALALETITDLHKEKLEALDKTPELKAILDDVLTKEYKLDGKDQTLRIKNVLQHFPEALIPLAGNIMTGNMISIAAGIFCVMVGSVTAINEQKSFSKQRNEMREMIQASKDMLRENGGLDIDYPYGSGLDFLKDSIRSTEAEIQAIKNIQNKIESGEINIDDPNQVKLQFKAELESVKEQLKNQVSKADNPKLEVQSLGYYAKKAFFGSFSYENSREIFAPLAFHNKKKQEQLKNFYEDRVRGNDINIRDKQTQQDKTIETLGATTRTKNSFVNKIHDKSPVVSRML